MTKEAYITYQEGNHGNAYGNFVRVGFELDETKYDDRGESREEREEEKGGERGCTF